MPPTQHASFSASASARLMACPGSYELGIRADDGTRTSSVFAAEGALAHAVSEACLNAGLEVSSFLGQTRSADGFTYTIDEAFIEAVEVYVGFVRGLRALGYVVALESVVSPQTQWAGLAPLDVHLFGTGDCIAYHPHLKKLIIADLKFGKGIAVEVEGNSQLHYYASGSADPELLRAMCAAEGETYRGVDSVSINVIQPRAFHRDGPIRSQTKPLAEVREWARTTLYDAVKTSLEDGGKTLSAGDHCRFCPVLAHCNEPQKVSMAAAQAMFAGAPIQNIPDINDDDASLPDVHLSDAVVADLLDKITIIEPWLKSVKELASSRLTKGRKLEGWKLVPSKGRRQFAEKDQAELTALLEGEGLDPDDFTDVKIKSPAQVERAVGKKAYQAHVAPHVVKESKGKSLAPQGDPRDRIAQRSAAQAFNVTNPKGNTP